MPAQTPVRTKPHGIHSRERWKSIERWWAEKLGGKRVPVSGRGRGDVPDIEHPTWAIEVKAGQRLVSSRVKEALAQAQASAVRTGRMPLVCLEESRDGPQGNIRLVVIPLEAFLEWYGPSQTQERRG